MGLRAQLHAPAALPPGKGHGIHYTRIAGCVGPRPGIEGCGRFRPHRDSIPEPSSP
jgi:hypothetical protein